MEELNLSSQMKTLDLSSSIPSLNLSGMNEPTRPAQPAHITRLGGEDYGAAPEKNPYGENVTREEILNNPEYMSLIRRGMNLRFGVGGRNEWTADFKYKDDMDDEELFEMWQNYQRSFAGGQTVTTANEVGWLRNASDEDKATMGQMYSLFDAMPGYGSKDMPWTDRADATRDYLKAAIYDPSTLLGLGIGRVLAGAGGKAGGAAVREIAKRTGMQMAKDAVKKVASKQAVTGAATDMAVSIGTDIGYQHAMIDTGVQEKYSAAQTGLAALGVLVIPSLVAAKRGIKKGFDTFGGKNFQDYQRISDQLAGQRTPAAIEKALKDNMDTETVGESVQDNLQAFLDNKDRYLPWTEAKEEAVEFSGKEAGDLNMDGDLTLNSLLFGDIDGEHQGLITTLADNGFVYIPRWEDDTVTNFLADIVADSEEWLGRETADMIEDVVMSDDYFRGKFGDSEDILGEFARHMKKRYSSLGRDLNLMSQSARKLKKPYESQVERMNDFFEASGLGVNASAKKKKGLSDVRLGQTWYKRLLTAHPGTTALNIKGWAWTHAMNNISEVVESALHAGNLVDPKGRGKAYHSLMGVMRDGYNLFNATDTAEEALSYFSLRPETEEALFRIRTGGVTSGEAMFKELGINNPGKARLGAEATVDFAQRASGVVLQDEITKQLSFMSNLDKEIRREFGMTYSEFIVQDDAWLKMHSKKFAQAEAKAINTTLEETYSRGYSNEVRRQTQDLIPVLAKTVEDISSAPGMGILIPFGRFFNNTIARLGDYSGVNFVRSAMQKTMNPEATQLGDKQLTELLAKGLVGWGGVYTMIPNAESKVEEGLAWNQERREDGSIADVTYEVPEAYFRLFAQMAAHNRMDGEVPVALTDEAGDLLVGQTVRDLGDAGAGVYSLMKEAMADPSRLTEILGTLFGAAGQRVVSGATRPLDPLNEAAILIAGLEGKVPDRRQGVEAYNYAVRYFDQIPGIMDETLPERESSTNKDSFRDFGKQVGVRSTQGSTAIERMMASVGTRPWKEVKWDGPPELKNVMDGIIEPILNMNAQKVLSTTEYFTAPLPKREALLSAVLKKSKEEAKEVLDYSVNPEDTFMKGMQEIYSGYSKKDIKRATELLGIEEDIPELSDDPNGYLKLMLIQDVLENQEDYLGIPNIE